MKFRFAAKSSWKYIAFLWLAAAVMTAWLGTARVQAFGLSWIEIIAYITSLLGLLLAIYFWNMKRVVLFEVKSSGVSAHEGLGRKRRELSWEQISFMRWEEERCVFVKLDGSEEAWGYQLMKKEDHRSMKQELAKYKPLYVKTS